MSADTAEKLARAEELLANTTAGEALEHPERLRRRRARVDNLSLQLRRELAAQPNHNS